MSLWVGGGILLPQRNSLATRGHSFSTGGSRLQEGGDDALHELIRADQIRSSCMVSCHSYCHIVDVYNLVCSFILFPALIASCHWEPTGPRPREQSTRGTEIRNILISTTCTTYLSIKSDDDTISLGVGLSGDRGPKVDSRHDTVSKLSSVVAYGIGLTFSWIKAL